MWPFDEIENSVDERPLYFSGFLDDIPDGTPPMKEPCVADLLLLWLIDGDALDWYGTYESWLLAIIAMMDWWDRDSRDVQYRHAIWGKLCLRDEGGNVRQSIPIFNGSTEASITPVGDGRSRYGHPVLHRQTFEFAKRKREVKIEKAILDLVQSR
jgi:hypothetical protein